MECAKSWRDGGAMLARCCRGGCRIAPSPLPKREPALMFAAALPLRCRCAAAALLSVML
jgi:hypothetical protein